MSKSTGGVHALKGKYIALTLGLMLGVSVLAAACSSQPTPIEPGPSQSLPLDPNRETRPETPIEPGQGESQQEPGNISQPPISIIDDMDPNECNFIHNINACFSDGCETDGGSLDECMEQYFDDRDDSAQRTALRLLIYNISAEEYMNLYFLARDDLAKRFEFNPLTIKIASIEKVDWNDSSLGNAEPGMFYSQVITPGSRLVLESDGTTYTYHTSKTSVTFVK